MDIAPTGTTDLVRQVDVLFNSKGGRHLDVSPARRVDAFFYVIGQIAEAEIEAEMENEYHDPLPGEVEGRVAQRELQHVEEWKAMLDAAYMRKAQELGGPAWLNGDGRWQDLADVLVEAIPEEQKLQRSWRARAVARFVREGVPAMREVGVSPTLIESAYRDDKPSILSEVSAAVNTIRRLHLDEEEEREEYKRVLEWAATTPTLLEFRTSIRERYRPDDPPPERAIYTSEYGDREGRVRVAIEASETVWDIIKHRCPDKLREAPGSLFLSPSPALVETVLGVRQVYEDTGELVVWDTNGQVLMRKATTCNPWRHICLDALEKRAGEWVSINDIRAVSAISPIDIRHAMGELCSYVKDGWNAWAVRHEKKELWRLSNESVS